MSNEPETDEADCYGRWHECKREDCQRGQQCLGGSKADYDRWAGVTTPPAA